METRCVPSSIKGVALAAAKKGEHRPVLEYVRVDGNSATAANGWYLINQQFEDCYVTSDTTAIMIDADIIRKSVKVKPEEVSLAGDDYTVTIKQNGMSIETNPTARAENFPKYDAIIPAPIEPIGYLNIEFLSACLDAIKMAGYKHVRVQGPSSRLQAWRLDGAPVDNDDVISGGITAVIMPVNPKVDDIVLNNAERARAHRVLAEMAEREKNSTQEPVDDIKLPPPPVAMYQ